MEDEEKLMGGGLPTFAKQIHPAQENVVGTREEANGWVIVPPLEKVGNSFDDEVSKEDKRQKTRENGQDSSAAEENPLPAGETQVLTQPGEELHLVNTPDLNGECSGDNQGDILHDTSVLPVNPDNIQDPDASYNSVVEKVQPSGEAAPDLPNAAPSLKKTHAKAQEKDVMKLHGVPSFPVDPLEVDTNNPDALNTQVVDEIQLLEEATTDQLHREEKLDLKDPIAEVNGETQCSEDKKHEMELQAASTSNSREVDNINKLSKESKDEVSEMGRDSFIQDIMSCLKDLNDEEADQASGDNERNESICESPDTSSMVAGESATNQCCLKCLECTEYFEPALFEYYVENESVSGLNESNSRACLEDEVQALNRSYLTLEMDNYDRHLPDLENSFLEDAEELPVGDTVKSFGTLSTGGRGCGTSSIREDYYPTIKLPIPENLKMHCWMALKVHAFNLGTSGFSYIGGIAGGKMHGYGRLLLGDSGEFFDGIWNMNRLMQLHTCNFISDPGNQTVFIFKRQNDYLLTIYETHYVARVIFDQLEELDFIVDVGYLKRAFFRKLKVLELVADELEQKKQASLNKIAALLAETIGVGSNPIVQANTFILLSTYLGMPDTDLSEIFRDRRIPVKVRTAAADLFDCEKRYLSNTSMFYNKAAKLQKDLRAVLANIYNNGIVQYRQMLIDRCPSAFPCLLSSIRSLPELKILYITGEDMSVFDHLSTQPCFEHYEPFFTNLAESFCLTISNIKTGTAPSTVIPVMSPVYGFLVKSFWEIISEIIAAVDCYEYKDMLIREAGIWKLQENIRWPEIETNNSMTRKVLNFLKSPEKKSSMLHKALDIQYNIIFQMMIYFSPENYVANKKYEYNFHVLEQDLSWWEKGLKMVRKKVGLAKRLQKLSTERIVWLCLLDYTIYEVFKDDPKCQILLKPYNALLQGQISFIEKSPTESHEKFRVMTHSILKFITSTVPYFREVREKPGTDVEILVQQMWTFSTASKEIEDDPTTFSNFRDLMAEYNRYLSLRLFINVEPTPGHFSEQISQMMQTFMRIVATSLKKTVPTTALVRYLRSLNDFLDDYKNIDFLAMWFVKSRFFDTELLERVDNKLSSGGNCSYRVVDIEKFVQVVQILGKPIPHHHIMQVVSQLLVCIENCLNKQWQSRDANLHVTQLECTALLLDASRKSFMYLKEQPDYVDFETFEKESIDPFVRLVHDCGTLAELKNRSGKVSESFWYIRKIDEIGIERALQLFKNVNTCQVSDKLLDCYNLYLEHYEEYVTKFRSLVSEGKSHAEGLNDVALMVNKTNPMHFSMWTEEFKTNEIPVMLAGLSAVWSILVSKDVSGSGKFLKPHCIQILCVLRLLSVDLQISADNHLAQVLTGQGKSVILGLLSAVLALTGHEVRVLCYSEYLSSRDQMDFDEFFCTFQLDDKIEYSTFERMACSLVKPVINGRQSSLHEMVEKRVMNHKSWPSVTRATPISKNAVLLIDEVDVFFNDKFYGQSYYAGVFPGFPGLAKVQEFIWSIATNNRSFSSSEIEGLTRKHINDEVAARDGEMMKFNAFLNKPGTFPLLVDGVGGNLLVKTYTNRSLFDEHLLRMINDALKVRDYTWAQSGFKLAGDGTIQLKDTKYDMYCDIRSGYRNVFNYFRLKQSDYDSKHFRNYGYLDLWAGQISYSRLPSQYQLILGVSGTLTNLGEYEKIGINFYGIHNFSVLPSFFGESNLEFNEEADFHYFNKERDWLKEIYDRANSIVDSRRAVLIFFESDVAMDVFSKEYQTKFDRLNEITENTAGIVRDAYIDEAGLPCTVTLATRGMGRGVDYKSSLSVEKKGGVHVVQTFLSVDVKEEVQIKGRTARKDNKGSYELIICREHLVNSKIIPEDDHNAHSYGSLEKIRKKLSDEKGKTVHEKIQKSEHNHNTTMKYFGLV